ncbi:Ti-type conjugative transfer relaxase TraA [Roseibium sp.]|uniref:Ti-type conjugative transfer relaxase TraA n=2 Tax=Alphaproteobacteria TaxID=28211 RepID=UPI0032639342
MSIYHFSAQVISRSQCRSAVAASAYRHRTQMTVSNEMDHRKFDYSDRDTDLVHEELALPDQPPEWFRALTDGRSVAGSSEALWNAVEAHETRANGQLAREIVIALPSELSRTENIALMQGYIREAFTSRGMIADWVYHDKENNPHVHIMLTLAPMTEKGFGSKWEPVLDERGNPVRAGGQSNGKIQYRAWAGDKQTLKAWRELWACHANKSLELAGHDARIDHRSYAAQGIDLQPTTKIGVQARNIERKAKARGREIDLERMEWHAAACRENVTRITRRPEIVIDAVTREKSVFDERDIAKYLHRYVDDPGQFQDLLARVLTSADVVKLAVEVIDPVTGEQVPAKFTSREMLRLEAEMGRRADDLVSATSHGVDVRSRAEILSRVQQLSDEQRVAIERITGGERMASVVGRAGAGKTTMMKASREVWEADGYRVVGSALAGKAAEGLEKEAGIASRTLASWQLSWSRGEELPDRKTVFVIDEAGMVDSRQMSVFVETIAKTGGKLVLIGDAEQLQPIEAGAAFRSLTGRTGYAELGTIYRQRDEWMREASMDLARGEVAKALDAYQAHGHVVGLPLKDQVFGAMIEDWSADYDPSKSMLMLAHLRKDVHRLNRMARQVLIERGVIGAGDKFRTEEGERFFAAGDQIVFLKNDRDLNVKNGMLARVVEAGEGRFVAEIGEPGSDQARRVEVDQKTYRNVDHGYATTIHKSQGATVDRVKVLATRTLDRHLAYVAMTRHRSDMKLYASQEEFRDRRSGELVAHGKAPFENKVTNRDSYFVTLQNSKGEHHTTWGVDLERALSEAGCQPGDKIGLHHVGKVALQLSNGQQAHRNEWKVNTSAELLSGQLKFFLSRSGAKETTLDYASSELYAQAFAYANNRGLYGLRVAKAMIQNQRRWFVEQRAKLAILGERLAALGAKLGMGSRGLATSANTVQTDAREYVAPPQPWIRGVQAWPMPVKQAVEAKLQSEASLTPQWEALENRVSYIYRLPEKAMRAMRLDDLVKNGEAAHAVDRDRLLQDLTTNPEQFGELKGKTGLLAGAQAKQERNTALKNVNGLIRNINSYVTLRAEIADLRTVELERERDLSRVDVPTLSPAAETVLTRIRDAIDRNDLNAGLSFLLADRHVEAELGEVAAKLDQRFGERAFMAGIKPEGPAFEKAAVRVASEDKAKLAEAWPKFNAIQKIAANKRSLEQVQARALKKDRSKDQGMVR